MKLYFLGGAGVVTGVSYLLETSRVKVLIDCGLFQGAPELEEQNYKSFAFDPRQIEVVVVSHAHLDHIGRLPQLVEGGFSGEIFATPPTIDFAHLILDDSVQVLEEKAKKAGIVPFFDKGDIAEVMQRFRPLEYRQRREIAPGIFLTFYNAGHVLGSAILELEAEGRKIIFSGDLGHPPMPLLPPPDFLEEADYVLVESTYGDSLHESPAECQGAIERVIEDTIASQGVLLIPSFALERAQQLIYHLNNLVEQKRIPQVPVFIDSPLASRITEVYKKYTTYFNGKTQTQIKAGDDIFQFPGLRFTHSSQESKAINEVPPPKILIAGSGMSQGGRILHHEARYLVNPKNTLLLVTYQAEGTLGRQIAEGAKKVIILDQTVAVKAKIKKISGYSSHADQRFLMEWLGYFRKPYYLDGAARQPILKKIWVVQGEEKSARTLAVLIRDRMGMAADIPSLGQVVELE